MEIGGRQMRVSNKHSKRPGDRMTASSSGSVSSMPKVGKSAGSSGEAAFSVFVRFRASMIVSRCQPAVKAGLLVSTREVCCAERRRCAVGATIEHMIGNSCLGDDGLRIDEPAVTEGRKVEDLRLRQIVQGCTRKEPFVQEIGIHRRHGQLDGRWRDCVIVERLLGNGTIEGHQ
jgi:hypothetical protein